MFSCQGQLSWAERWLAPCSRSTLPKSIPGKRQRRWKKMSSWGSSENEIESVKSLSWVWLFETPWTIVHQVPLSVGFSRQEYWSGLSFPYPGDLPNPGMEPGSPALQADSVPENLSHKGVSWGNKGAINSQPAGLLKGLRSLRMGSSVPCSVAAVTEQGQGPEQMRWPAWRARGRSDHTTRLSCHTSVLPSQCSPWHREDPWFVNIWC